MSNDSLRDLDARIATGLRAGRLVDQAQFEGVAKPVDGYYIEDSTEDGGGEDLVIGLGRTFDCRLEDVPESLELEDIVTVVGYGEFRYIGSKPYGNGRVFLELGTVL